MIEKTSTRKKFVHEKVRNLCTIDYQRWYNVGKQLAQPYSDCGKSNLPTVDLQGLSSVYSAPVVDCEISVFVQS